MEYVMTALAIGGWTVFVLTVIAGVLLSMLGLFGTWIIFAAVAIAYVVSGFNYFSWAGLAILLGLSILGEVLETAAAGYGASRFGGGRGSIVAAIAGCIVGAIVGAPFLLIIGAIIGACLGAFIGATLYELVILERRAGDAAYTGHGAALGKVAGMFAKFTAALLMVVTLVLDLWVF